MTRLTQTDPVVAHRIYIDSLKIAIYRDYLRAAGSVDADLTADDAFEMHLRRTAPLRDRIREMEAAFNRRKLFRKGDKKPVTRDHAI